VMGFALEVPGVPDYYESYSAAHGVKVIAGTSDSPADSADLAWQEFAEDYARRYNALLLQHLSEGAGDSSRN
jgi:hypothetical protein